MCVCVCVLLSLVVFCVLCFISFFVCFFQAVLLDLQNV